jgi:hypothetical protein
MTAELRRELGPGHELYGQTAGALAKCGHYDSVLFALSGDRFVQVRL